MKTKTLAKTLMSFDTRSPVEDEAPLEFVKQHLLDEGINCQILDINGVKNLVSHFGNSKICFNGHLDVVPPGKGWNTDPFKPVERNGNLIGRGATDMKGELAAMIKAYIRLYKKDFEGASLMIVGDEEIGGDRGTKPILNKHLTGEKTPELAVVGEPTDMNIQVGMRGILWLNINLRGEEYHASRPGAGESAVEHMPEVLRILKNLEIEDESPSELPKSTVEITDFESSGVYNSAPSKVKIGLDIRYGNAWNKKLIMQKIESELDKVGCQYNLQVEAHHGEPFLLKDEGVKSSAKKSIRSVTDSTPEYVTEGGASDGRFFAENDIPFIEIGLNQENVHKANEKCSIQSMRNLEDIYVRFCLDY